MKYIAVVCLLVFCVACSSKPPVNPLADAGAQRFGPASVFLIFEVPAEEDQPFKLTKATPAGRRLATLIAPARTSLLRVIVGGPSSESTKKAVIEALSHYKGEALGGLELVFVGEVIDARAVQQAAKPLLATVYFAQSTPMPSE